MTLDSNDPRLRERTLPRRSYGSSWGWGAAAIVALLLIGFLGFGWWGGDDTATTATTTPPATTSEPAGTAVGTPSTAPSTAPGGASQTAPAP